MFPEIKFKGTLRPSQADVAKIAQKQLASGQRNLHIVAPPGSGKTVLGLYLWAEQVKTPALVLSPNSAIQAQWAARTDLFTMPEDGDCVSTEPDKPSLLTSLTYQSVTLPKRGGEDIENAALELWREKLLEKEQAADHVEAASWIKDLKKHNPKYYEKRFSSYRKSIRDSASMEGRSLEMLHESSLGTLNRLKEAEVGLIIFDECHHLMTHWGRVLADASKMLGDPILIGLTATPPDRSGQRPADVQRYDEFFGPIDYEVPVPAVVKDGFLAPYQDLAYFVRPSADELSFVAGADEQLEELVEELCNLRPTEKTSEQGFDGGIDGEKPDATELSSQSHHEDNNQTEVSENPQANSQQASDPALRDPSLRDPAPSNSNLDGPSGTENEIEDARSAQPQLHFGQKEWMDHDGQVSNESDPIGNEENREASLRNSQIDPATSANQELAKTARQFGLQVIDFEKQKIDLATARLIPEETALEHNVVATGEQGKVLLIAIANPYDLDLTSKLASILGRPVKPTSLASRHEIVKAIDEAYQVGERYESGKKEIPQPESLLHWIPRILSERRLATKKYNSWSSFYRRDPQFIDAARRFMAIREIELPENVPPIDGLLDRLVGDQEEVPQMDILIPVLDRYVRHRLRRSPHAEDHQLARNAIRRLRMLGVQITETGAQACASPVGRVLAYSSSKSAALIPILNQEMEHLGDKIRAVVITDYEKTSAVTSEIEHLLDAESGGAIAAFKTIICDSRTDRIDPVLVTGSSVLVDDDICDKFREEANKWLVDNGYQVELRDEPIDGFHYFNGKGADWCPRVYVQMITELFQRGIAKCLVGTRGLLGEGWDANKINVLVDLTTVTTSMTVNQLRGRSIRLDPQEPQKLSNNWDVVCIAPEFAKGLDDYHRFEAKHSTLYGITDDGAIEKGVGHVHAAFTKLKPEGIEGSTQVLNADMLQRVAIRDKVRQMWRIGQPYKDQPVRALEAKVAAGENKHFPPFKKSKDPWNPKSLTIAIGNAILFTLSELRLIEQRYSLHVGERAGNYIRAFLEDASESENVVFTQSLQETLGPLRRPRYIIPREITMHHATWLSSILPKIIGRFFEKHENERVMLHAVPAAFAKNKSSVEVFQRYWNQFVSPGEAVYAFRGDGQKMMESAIRAGQTPRGEMHQKDIFL